MEQSLRVVKSIGYTLNRKIDIPLYLLYILGMLAGIGLAGAISIAAGTIQITPTVVPPNDNPLKECQDVGGTPAFILKYDAWFCEISPTVGSVSATVTKKFYNVKGN